VSGSRPRRVAAVPCLRGWYRSVLSAGFSPLSCAEYNGPITIFDATLAVSLASNKQFFRGRHHLRWLTDCFNRVLRRCLKNKNAGVSREILDRLQNRKRMARGKRTDGAPLIEAGLDDKQAA
jgi:hypothetical protein